MAAGIREYTKITCEIFLLVGEALGAPVPSVGFVSRFVHKVSVSAHSENSNESGVYSNISQVGADAQGLVLCLPLGSDIPETQDTPKRNHVTAEIASGKNQPQFLIC